MRTICAVTVGRSDWGIYRPILKAIQQHHDLKLHLVAGSSHIVRSHGMTVDEIIGDGFEIHDTIEMLLASDSPEAIAKSMGLGTIGFAQIYQRVRPDLLLVLGDRFEMHAAALAATPFRIPIAHVHGGEVTQGAIDDAYRHAITKYSHLHFVSTAAHAQRVIQLGEEPWRVTVSGAPALDNLSTLPMLSRSELEARLQISFDQPPLLVTMHPVTLQYEQADEQVQQLLQVLAEYDLPIIITRPNADTSHSAIIERLELFCRDRSHVRLVSSLGTCGYFSLMRIAAAMVGNSSSGIIEAASFRLPVVNIGLRQSGRPRSANVIDTGCSAQEIRDGIQQALSEKFRNSLSQLKNVYGDGNAACRIADVIGSVRMDESLIIKQFHDLPSARSEMSVPELIAA